MGPAAYRLLLVTYSLSLATFSRQRLVKPPKETADLFALSLQAFVLLKLEVINVVSVEQFQELFEVAW